MRLSPVSNAGAGSERPRTCCLIIAGKERHAREVAYSRHLPYGTWRFVNEPYQLYGVTGAGYSILVYETWRELSPHARDHIRQLIRRAQERGCTVERVFEEDIR